MDLLGSFMQRPLDATLISEVSMKAGAPKAPDWEFMEWPQGLCMEPLGPPPHVFLDMYGATRTPLMYSSNGHKAYV